MHRLLAALLLAASTLPAHSQQAPQPDVLGQDAALLAAPAPAPAPAKPTAPLLRASVTVSSDLVRLGDLIDGLSPALADRPVFRSPDLGTTGTVQAARVVDAATGAGVAGLDAGGLAEVAVTRASRTVSVDEMRRVLALAIARQNGLADPDAFDLHFDDGARAAHVEPDATGPVQAMELDWNPVTGRFLARLGLSGSRVLDTHPLRLAGTAVETVTMPVYARALDRGEVVQAADVVMVRQPRPQGPQALADGLEAAIGQAVRHTVRAGQPVLAADLTRPEIVARGEEATLTFEVPGLILTVRAKVMGGGALGDTVPVLNLQSQRVVQARVAGPGQVTAMIPGVTTAAAEPASVAALN